MVKLKETNLDGVKAMARTLLFTDIHKTSLSPIVVQHAKGEEYGISERTMNKAKKKLPIKTFRDKGCWYWALDRENG